MPNTAETLKELADDVLYGAPATRTHALRRLLDVLPWGCEGVAVALPNTTLASLLLVAHNRIVELERQMPPPEEERRAWDRFYAAAITSRSADHPSADRADRGLAERRARFPPRHQEPR